MSDECRCRTRRRAADTSAVPGQSGCLFVIYPSKGLARSSALRTPAINTPVAVLALNICCPLHFCIQGVVAGRAPELLARQHLHFARWRRLDGSARAGTATGRDAIDRCWRCRLQLLEALALHNGGQRSPPPRRRVGHNHGSASCTSRRRGPGSSGRSDRAVSLGDKMPQPILDAHTPLSPGCLSRRRSVRDPRGCAHAVACRLLVVGIAHPDTLGNAGSLSTARRPTRGGCRVGGRRVSQRRVNDKLGP